MYIKDFAQMVTDGSASLFLGAGSSVDSGLPTWKELFRALAEEISIDVDNSPLSLYDIAQIYENVKGNTLRDRVKDSINTISGDNPSLDILTNLPCSSIWTTNYDCFLEDSFKKRGISPNVITTEQDLTSVRANSRVNIYKLNGDINSFNSSSVITRTDYENYPSNHSLMLSFLKRELITHSFLFIGYSFTDGLVLSCLAKIREAIGASHMPQHYAIMKREESLEFKYVVDNYKKNYNLNVILIDDYSEISDILELIHYWSIRKNVFISGALDSDQDDGLMSVDSFCTNLARRITNSNYRIVNGYGYKVGYYIACAITNEMIKKGYNSFQDKLLMYPFNEHLSRDEKTRHREYMISKASVAIFIYGSGDNDSGMMEECKIAQEHEIPIIPIGITGGTAMKIYDTVCENILRYPYLEKEIDVLGSADVDNNTCINATMKCIANALEIRDISHLKHFL